MRRNPALGMVIALACAASSATRLESQARSTPNPPPGELRSVSGRVLTARGAVRRPTANVWVTLHRIAPDSAAPLDSMRTGPGGEYAFRYRTFGDTSAVYLIAGRYGGIAYFAEPLTQHTVTGAAADLIVYDTASSGVPVTVESRHVVVSAPDGTDARRVVEVFVLANAADRTRVASAASPTFSAVLPAGATEPRVAEGEVGGDAITFAGGRVQVTAPVAPGTKRVAYSYKMPATAGPMGISVSDSAAMLELLVEDSAATVSGNVVREEAPAALSGRTFRRYTGQFVANAATLRVTAPSGVQSRISAVGVIVIVIGLGMAVTFVRAARRGPDSSVPEPDPAARLASPGGAA